MSFADQLRAEKAKLEAQKRQENTKKKRSPKKSSGTGSRSRTVEWKFEDEVIALYLYLSDASKFFKENYSMKRKISVRAMSMKMSVFESLHRGKSQTNVNDQTLAVYDKYRDYEIKALQKVVISILRGEHDPAELRTATTVIR